MTINFLFTKHLLFATIGPVSFGLVEVVVVVMGFCYVENRYNADTISNFQLIINEDSFKLILFDIIVL